MGNSKSLVHTTEQLLSREQEQDNSKHRHTRRSTLNRELLALEQDLEACAERGRHRASRHTAHRHRHHRGRAHRSLRAKRPSSVEIDDCFRRLDETELKRLKRVFSAACGGRDAMGEAEFEKALKELQPEIGHPSFPERLYAVFDTDGEGLDFHEFVGGMAVLLDGTPEEKLELAFRELTVDGDGCLTPGDLFHVMRDALINGVHMNLAVAHEEMSEKQVEALERKLSARVREFVADAFVEIDTRGDNKITFDEFKQWGAKHPQFLALLLAFKSKDLRKNLDTILDATEPPGDSQR